MMKNNAFLIVLIFAVLGKHGLAQQTSVVIPPSPDAASLGVYGKTPVSTYTGIPDINIPLYSVNCKDVNISLNLSYYAAGITVEQEASWVGLGWTLNGGGVITRVVRGGDDMQFATDGYSNLQMGYQGYPYDPDESSSNFLFNVCQKSIDPEPDIFYFNFMGKNGSFILENGQNPAVNFVSGTPLKSEKIDIKYDRANHRWQIKTPDGYTYYFGTVELSETLHGTGDYGKEPANVTWNNTNGGFMTNDDLVVSAWYLDKVVTPLGEVVNFVYDSRGSNSLQYLYGSARLSISDVKQTVIIPTIGTGCYNPPLQTNATKNFTFHVYLKEIQYPLGKIVFQKSSRDDMLPATLNDGNLAYLNWGPVWMGRSQYGPQKLDAISVLDNTGKTLKRFDLTYDYFNADATGVQRYSLKRLKLNKVKECSDNECKPDYQLFYDELNPLPSKYSNAQDFWGYYNGANSNISRIPHGTFFNPVDNKYYSLGDADRQPNAAYMTSGTIKKIIYPTGGMTEFEFEPHDYFTFGTDAFLLTDFVNNSPVGLTGLITAESDANAFQVVNFSLAETSEIIVNETMTYYPSATTSTPCDVVDPGLSYVGSEPWYSLENTGTSAIVMSRPISDFLNFFTNNYNSNCAISPQTPEAIDPIYRAKRSIILDAGTYQLKVYRRQKFTIHVGVLKNGMPSREINQNSQGVYAKNAGGLRIKKVKTSDNLTSISQVKVYDYTLVGGNNQRYSTGKLLQYPIYHVPFYCTDGIESLLVSIMGHSWNNSPLGTTTSGASVGYDMVTELHGQNGENGKIEYYYANQIEVPIEFPILFEGFPTVKRTSNGLATDIKQFDNLGNLVKAENFEYEIQLRKDIKGLATKQILQMGRGYQGLYVQSNCTNRNMISMPYAVVSDRWVPKKKTERMFSKFSPADFIENVTEYTYDMQTHLQLSTEKNTTSSGDIVEVQYSYPPNASWIPTAMWQDKFIYDKVVEKRTFKNSNLVNTYKAFYEPTANTYLLTKEQNAKGASSLETIGIYGYTTTGALNSASTIKDPPKAYLWGYNNNYLIAQAVNAKSNEILFDGFEENVSNWEAGLTIIDNSFSYTGKSSGRIDKPTAGEQVCLNNNWLNITLSSNKKFLFSGWVYSTGPSVDLFLIMKRAGETGYFSYNEHVQTNTPGKWVYLEKVAEVPSDVTQMTVRLDNNGGGTVWFDDIRLHPADAQMTSFTYDPLIGMTSQSDIKGRPIFYDYDEYGRLVLIRDHDKSIIKKFCYNYSGQTENCQLFYNDEQIQVFTRACNTGETGSNVTYIVPAGKYLASSLIAANAKALDDIIRNGQTYSNTHGACTVVPCSGCNGEQYLCVGSECLLGIKIYTFSDLDPISGMYYCIYHYEFDNGAIVSQNYTEWNTGGYCPVNP